MDRKSKARDINNILQETSSQRILLEEYRALNADYLNLRSEGVSRVNFFVTAMSVVLGGVLVIASSNSKLPVLYFKLILLTAALILATIGLEIYSYLIQRAISSDHLMRGLARIRNYFVKLDPQIRNYFVTKIYDTPTASLTHKHSGLRRTTQIIEGFFVGLIFTVSSTFFPFSETVILGLGVGVTAITILWLEINAHRRLNKAFKSAEAEMKFNDDLNE
jgi:hypothetical protein